MLICLVDAYFLNWNQFINPINSALRTLANIVIRCGEFCHHTSIKQSRFGHYLMQMIACLGMTKRKRESCMRRHFLSIVIKNEIVYYFSLFLPTCTHLFVALRQQKAPNRVLFLLAERKTRFEHSRVANRVRLCSARAYPAFLAQDKKSCAIAQLFLSCPKTPECQKSTRMCEC